MNAATTAMTPDEAARAAFHGQSDELAMEVREALSYMLDGVKYPANGFTLAEAQDYFRLKHIEDAARQTLEMATPRAIDRGCRMFFSAPRLDSHGVSVMVERGKERYTVTVRSERPCFSCDCADVRLAAITSADLPSCKHAACAALSVLTVGEACAVMASKGVDWDTVYAYREARSH